MSNKAIILEAESKIEAVLQELQDQHGIHTFRIQLIHDPDSESVEVTIIKDERY